MSRDLVRTAIENGIAEVCLNRPEKHNSLMLEMFHALANTGQTLQDDTSIRVAILYGAGPSFCAGLDFALMAKNSSKGERLGKS
jgi:enoyl-CoA hydratase/carnithine racemase